MKKLAGFTAVVAALLITTPLSAHHSVGGTYLQNAPLVRIEGTVKEFLLRNPHSYLRVADDKLVDSRGLPVTFDVEWAPGGVLGQKGVRPGSFKVGDHVIITGNPGRNVSDHRLYLRTLDRPADGFHTEQPFDAFPWTSVR